MCGIAGLVGVPREPAVLEGMLGALRHRGPDDRGTLALKHATGTVRLGSTRLAIINLSPAGHMPMRDARNGNALVYNGEVYNFRELRDELEGHGERFQSATDTEVVLKAYGRWGRGCIERLQGMFAFALWDPAAGELSLARDRLGEKPLYYWNQGGFAFASEVRALLASGLVPRRLNYAAG